MRVKVEYRQASKENWKRFCEETGIVISFVSYQNIIYTFNYSFRDHLLETGNKGKLPWGIGDFAICKFKRKKNKILENGDEIIGLSVDWKKTRESKKYIYHMNNATEGYNFKWKWFINSARFKFAEVWVFKPARITSRMIRHYLSQPNYQYIYKQWELVKH